MTLPALTFANYAEKSTLKQVSVDVSIITNSPRSLRPDSNSESMCARNHAPFWELRLAMFVDDDDYRSLVDALERALTKIKPGALAKALANVEPSAFTGTVTKDEFMIALCESADVLPRGDARSL